MSNLYLIGYRGTGKTTLAPLLAQALAWSVVELDQLIEQAAGRTIPQIFAEQGEDAFRELEAQMLLEVARGSQQVVSTGGGVILRPANRKILRETGLVVWLQASVPTIYQRLQAEGNTRPALTRLAPLEEITLLVQQRQPLYQATAHFTVDTEAANLEDKVKSILTYLKQASHGSV